MSKKGDPNRSPHLLLASWFVNHIIGRAWTQEDFRGQHLKRASEVLKRYAFNDIVGAIKAACDGIIGNFDYITDLSIIEKREPPLISQWLDYKNSEPPFWLETDHKLWKELTHEDYLTEWTRSGVPLPEGVMWTDEDTDPTRRSGRGESLAPSGVHQLHEGKRVSRAGQEPESGVSEQGGSVSSLSGGHADGENEPLRIVGDTKSKGPDS